MKLNITIDLRLWRASGIGRYLRNTVPTIIESLPESNFFLLGRTSVLSGLKNKYKNVNLVEYSAPIYSLNEQYTALKAIPRETDLLWWPHYNVPIFYRGLMVVTIYDVFHLAMPQYVRGLHRKLYAKIMYKIAVSKANRILTISQFSKKELIRLTDAKEEKISVVYLGATPDGNCDLFGLSEADKVKMKMKKPFILYVGNIKPHKNLKNLILAFDQVVKTYDCKLIIVGKIEGFLTDDKTTVEIARRNTDKILIAGEVNDCALIEYYKNAEVFVFPTQYEGFGLPPLEALLNECPVAASNIEVVREVCGKYVSYFDQNDPDDIANVLLEILQNEKKYNKSNNAKHISTKYQWRKCASETLGIIKRELSMLGPS